MLRNWFFSKEIDLDAPRYVGLQSRLFIMTMDLLFLCLLLLPFLFLQDNPLAISESFDVRVSKFETGEISEQALVAETISEILANGVIALMLLLLLFYLSWAWSNSTPAKWLMGVSIVDAKTHQTPTRKQYILRVLGYCLMSLFLLIAGLLVLAFLWQPEGRIGYLLAAIFFISPLVYMAFDKKKQGLHDKLARTVVLYHRKLSSEQEKKKQNIQLVVGAAIFLAGIIYLMNKGWF